MKGSGKIWLIIAASLVLLGSAAFVGVMTVLNWDFSKLSTSKYQTNSYEISEDFKSISVDTDTADITFVVSENEKYSVTCFEKINEKHEVSVKDGTLTVKCVDTRRWYEYIGLNFGTPTITVSIPQGEYQALSIKADTGDVTLPKEFGFESIDIRNGTGDVVNHASASGNVSITTSTGKIKADGICGETISLSVSTGDIILSDVSCKNLLSSGNTGDVILKSVIVQEKISIERSTGDVMLEACDAGELLIETDTGDVEGSLLSDKIFIIETDTGRKSVPDTASGGRCEITTDTGNIIISIVK